MGVQITAGQGTTIATDTVPAGEAQYVKLLDATAGSSTPVAPLTDAQLRAAPVPVSGPATDAQLRASALPVSLAAVPAHNVAVSNFPATQPVSGTVSVGNFPATQPVSLAANTPDVTDRAARLLGHVTVDNASLAVTGGLTDAQLRASAVPISDVRLPAALKTLPAGADGLAALPVYITAVLLLSYDAAARNLSTGALVANTAKQMLSIEHAASSTKTVKIRRIMVGGLQTLAVAGMVDIQITKGTAASTAGTVVTPNTRKGGDANSEAVVKSLPTIVAGTLGDTIPWGATAATANTPMPTMLVYDWQEGGETKPLQLRAGQLESIVVNVISTAAQNLTLTVSIDFTEE